MKDKAVWFAAGAAGAFAAMCLWRKRQNQMNMQRVQQMAVQQAQSAPRQISVAPVRVQAPQSPFVPARVQPQLVQQQQQPHTQQLQAAQAEEVVEDGTLGGERF